MGGLFNSTVLDVAIGLILIYFLLSIICTAINEWIAALLKLRSRSLRSGIRQLLGSQTLQKQPGAKEENSPGASNQLLVYAFYRHPLIKGMTNRGRHPSYLPARIFATTVIDLVTLKYAGGATFANLDSGIKALPDGEVKTSLLALLQQANGEIEALRKAIEGWFDDAMDRVSGWYKRRIQLVTLLVAIALVILSNADTVQISRKLWGDPVLRAALVDEAKARSQEPQPAATIEYPDEDDPTSPKVTKVERDPLSGHERDLLGQLLGWRGTLAGDGRYASLWFERIIGWLLTIFAISLGAPFWFDILNKFMNLRLAGKSPDEEAKKPEKKKLPPENRSA